MLFRSFSKLGVCDIYWVEVAALRVVKNVACRGYVFFGVFDPGAVVDGADTLRFFFYHWVRATAELGSAGFFWGVVWDGGRSGGMPGLRLEDLGDGHFGRSGRGIGRDSSRSRSSRHFFSENSSKM